MKKNKEDEKSFKNCGRANKRNLCNGAKCLDCDIWIPLKVERKRVKG